MIIIKTPMRMSFAGGGSDLSTYYLEHDGAVMSTSINKFVYTTINNYFDKARNIFKYSKTEIVDKNEEINHPLIKACMNRAYNKTGIEMTSMSDIPTAGAGLGSSSAFTVGLLKALYCFQNVNKSNEVLAEEACDVEINDLKEPIGKQDQYACAVGGINLIKFCRDDIVKVNPLPIRKSTRQELNENLIMFYTGVTRPAKIVLNKQKATSNKPYNVVRLKEMVSLAYEMSDSLMDNDLTEFGEMLHKGWLLKKGLTNNISNDKFDNIYRKALSHGAIGGKLLGAGGGGFFVFYCPKEKQQNLIRYLPMRHVTFSFEQSGSKIIYLED